jgi:hypothetical protein
MSIFLTQLASDNFQRPNESPLASPPWARDSFGQAGLQIISHLAQGTATFTDCTEIYTGVSLPNDQYASATLGAGIAGNANLVLGVRMVDNGNPALQMPGYFTRVSGTGNGGTWTIEDGTGGVLANGSGLTVNTGDVFVLAVIGTTLYALQNGVQFGSVTNAAHSSGSVILTCSTGASANAVQISNFACGKASTGPPPSNYYSVPDSRVTPNASRNVNGTLIYDVQTSSNPAVPGIDSRGPGVAPVASGTYPQNSRSPGVFGPGE